MKVIKDSGEGGKTGVATVLAVDGRLVSDGDGKSMKGMPPGHYRRPGIPSENSTLYSAFKEQVGD